MRIDKIHAIWWGDQDKTSVGLIADTDEGSGIQIGTLYDERSIIWDAIRAVPVENIADRKPAGPEDAENIILQRNRLLSESDWTQAADAPVDKTAWAAYRQALRDVTAQDGFPFNVVWPDMPV